MDDICERLERGAGFLKQCGFAYGHEQRAMRDAKATIESLRDKLAEANLTLVAFAAPTMVQYAKDCGLPKNSLHPNHYDILAKAGARMDSFTRAEIERTTT